MSDLVVKRWVRYGHDRLYVQTVDGTRLGYLDNKTGETVLDDEVHRHAFQAALTAHDAGAAAGSCCALVIPAQPTAATAPATPQAPVAPVPADPPRDTVESVAALAAPARWSAEDLASVLEPQPEPMTHASAGAAEEWADLAERRAGAAAREQALALKAAAPVKTFLIRALGVKTDERAWRIGADAEEAVASRLAKLGPRWKVLHAVPVGENGSDIDHVVIGPGGVYTINTKHHPDAAVWVGGNTFMVNGQRVPYIRNSRFEARRTAQFLTTALDGAPVITTGLIAVMGARKGFKVKSQPPDGHVVVMTRREVARWLSRQPVRLTDRQVEAIYAVARRADTWRK